MDCYRYGMICNTATRRPYCAPPFCYRSKECPKNTKCVKGKCDIRYHLDCISVKECCRKYPNVPVHCFRGKCSIWEIADDRQNHGIVLKNRCLGCDCPILEACVILEGKVSCRWDGTKCIESRTCGHGCFEDRDCGKRTDMKCYDYGYNGICLPSNTCTDEFESRPV